MWFSIVMLIFSTIVLIALVRNYQVNSYLMGTLEKVTKLAKQDIDNDRDWRWRYDVLDSVPYHEMVLKFWKPLDSFYPDKSFIGE